MLSKRTFRQQFFGRRQHALLGSRRTFCASFGTYETVATETPAFSATSFIVAMDRGRVTEAENGVKGDSLKLS